MTESGKTARREARLGARLRANLARRKDQARQRESTEAPGTAPPAGAPLPEARREEDEKIPSS